MARKDIRTTQASVACDVCGRRLLRGEHAEVYLAGGTRRNVCDLCGPRAAHEGWMRESAGVAAGSRRTSADRGPSLLHRLRGRRERVVGRHFAGRNGASHATEEDEGPDPPRTDPGTYAIRRNVQAVPASPEAKLARAIELFNLSDHPRTVAGIARSLGAPSIVVRSRPERPSVVSIVAAWELSWYRYEVDLADEGSGVRVAGQGTELAELGPDEQTPNAAADDEGELALAA